jgi:hypothetical protein
VIAGAHLLICQGREPNSATSRPIRQMLAMFAGFDMPASSAQTQQRLGWRPTGPGLIADLEQMRYF